VVCRSSAPAGFAKSGRSSVRPDFVPQIRPVNWQLKLSQLYNFYVTPFLAKYSKVYFLDTFVNISLLFMIVLSSGLVYTYLCLCLPQITSYPAMLTNGLPVVTQYIRFDSAPAGLGKKSGSVSDGQNTILKIVFSF
jgi:hypothetical protein